MCVPKVATRKLTLYAIEGSGINEKETKRHSESARKVYVPSGWRRVVIINITEDGGGERNQPKRRRDNR